MRAAQLYLATLNGWKSETPKPRATRLPGGCLLYRLHASQSNGPSVTEAGTVLPKRGGHRSPLEGPYR